MEADLEASQLNNRPMPIFWFNRDLNREIFDSGENEEIIKNWMRQEDNEHDLITDLDCIAGYEANIVILVGQSNASSPMSQHAYKLALSRCRGKFIMIP